MYFYKSNLFYPLETFTILNTSLFIAKRIIKSGKHSRKNSQTIIKIATTSTVLSVAVMILTIFISYGFKSNIIEKIKGFGSDIQIINFDANHSYDYLPISLDSAKLHRIRQLNGVNAVKQFITKPAVVKHKDLTQGVVLKAFAKPEDYAFFAENITQGQFPDFSQKEILISETLAQKLNINIGDKLLFYFIQEPIRYRKLTVSGFYSTDVYEIDLLFAMVDFPMLQKLNGWEPHQSSGYEITTKDEKTIDKVKEEVRPVFFKNNEAQNQSNVKVLSTKERFPNLYFGFDLFNTNVLIIISLMTIVASINLISTLLIIIIENKNIVGLVKSFGFEEKGIRKIFTYISFYLVLKGLFWGNLIGLGISFVQYYFKIIPLSPEHYYTSFVPIGFDWVGFIWLNVFTILIINLFLLLPSSYISRISPIKVIKFN